MHSKYTFYSRSDLYEHSIGVYIFLVLQCVKLPTYIIPHESIHFISNYNNYSLD